MALLLDRDLKVDGRTWNPVDPQRVEVFMRAVESSAGRRRKIRGMNHTSHRDFCRSPNPRVIGQQVHILKRGVW